MSPLGQPILRFPIPVPPWIFRLEILSRSTLYVFVLHMTYVVLHSVCISVPLFQVPRIPPSWPPTDEGSVVASESRSSRSGSPLPEVDNTDTSAVHLGKHKMILALHARLAAVFPEAFHVKETLLPYYELSADSNPCPLLRVDPDLSHTWFIPPPGPRDTFGYWTSAAKLPPNKKSLSPPYSEIKQLPRPPVFHVPDSDLKKLFESPVKEKVYLDVNVFDSASVNVKTSPHALIDAHLRASLFERHTTDAYMRMLVTLSDCAAGASLAVGPSEALSLLPELARQAALANARLGQSLTAAYVGNTVALRDHVLDKFVVPTRTGETLRGGGFNTERLFGPLPESFATLLDAHHGSGLRCKLKPASSSTSSVASASLPTTRSGSSAGLPFSKRSYTAFPSYKGGFPVI